MAKWYDEQIGIEALCTEIIGISSRQYRQLATDGKVPSVVDGKISFSVACREFIAHQRKLLTGLGSLTLTEERTRMTRISADRKELALEQERGEVINTEEAMKIWAGILVSFKKRMQAVPRKMSPMVFGSSKVTEIQEIMEKEVTAILNELSEPNLISIAKAASTFTTSVEKRTGDPKVRKPSKREPVG